MAELPGVLWVGPRTSKHKLSETLKIEPKHSNPLSRFLFGDNAAIDAQHAVLLVLLVPPEQRIRAATSPHAARGPDAIHAGSEDIVAAWNAAWLRMRWDAFARAASEDKAYLHVTSSSARAAAAAW
eukprot:CAMPEP_0172184648 /NCGR_PEP_ID=MMETSP1050-20130122/19700_1 /TAXON_ID=233186 /ORGANISM="Cryptomonas curvata, Strain CCAP979/52" /LENGTH=125 /DNA_ID=CAMNT_0012858485 /DNA_START=280 /DNA_END=654 /DNA_ORIENTATION=-